MAVALSTLSLHEAMSKYSLLLSIQIQEEDKCKVALPAGALDREWRATGHEMHAAQIPPSWASRTGAAVHHGISRRDHGTVI